MSGEGSAAGGSLCELEDVKHPRSMEASLIEQCHQALDELRVLKQKVGYSYGPEILRAQKAAVERMSAAGQRKNLKETREAIQEWQEKLERKREAFKALLQEVEADYQQELKDHQQRLRDDEINTILNWNELTRILRRKREKLTSLQLQTGQELTYWLSPKELAAAIKGSDKAGLSNALVAECMLKLTGQCLDPQEVMKWERSKVTIVTSSILEHSPEQIYHVRGNVYHLPQILLSTKDIEVNDIISEPVTGKILETMGALYGQGEYKTLRRAYRGAEALECD